MQPASKLLWKALLHKEKCAEADGALGQSQSAASAAAWAEALTPSPACPARGGFLALVSALLGCHPDPSPGSACSLTPGRGGFAWKGTLGCVTRCWLGCSLHWSHSHQQVEGGQCHPEPCSSGCICSCTKPWFGSGVLLQDVPRGLFSAFLQEQLLGHVFPHWGLLYFALDTWSDW